MHVLEVLRGEPGTTFDVGLINGTRGKATILALDEDSLHLAFQWGDFPRAPDPVFLIVGMPRPQSARDILREATSLGVASLHFVLTEKSEASYARSSLWRNEEWFRHVIAGAEQAFATTIPEVFHGAPLRETLVGLAPGSTRLALDNYEAAMGLAEHPALSNRPAPLILAFGPERGWSGRDREELRSQRFELVGLGSRVLRLETAVIAALALAKSARGTW